MRRAKERIEGAPWRNREYEWNRYLGYHITDDKDAVLLNKLGMTRRLWLERAERGFVAYRLATMSLDIPSRLDEEGMKAIHYWLYQDIYPWAGELRTIKVRKDEPFRGMDDAPALWRALERTDNMRRLDADDVPAALCDFYVRASLLGGFIQGNDLVAAVMTMRCAQAVGRPIDWTKLNTPTATLKELSQAYQLGHRTRFLDAMSKSVSSLIENPLLALKPPLGYAQEETPIDTATLTGPAEAIEEPIPAKRGSVEDLLATQQAKLAQLEALIAGLTGTTNPAPAPTTPPIAASKTTL
jgi:cell filamentation protein